MIHDTLPLRLAYLIRQYRERAKTSQEAFADMLGLHRAFYGRIERGHNLTLQTLEYIAKGFNGSPGRVLLQAVNLAWWQLR